MYFFDADTGALVWKDKGDTNKIFDIAFSRSTPATAVSVGTKHIKFWSLDTKTAAKGLFGSVEQTSFSCAVFDDQGTAYCGGANSNIYVWKSRENPKVITGAHKGGFICSASWSHGKLYTGAKDGNVTITDTASLTVEKSISFGNLIRAIDVSGNSALVGTRDGTIYWLDLGTSEKKVVIESHSDGELWGLAPVSDT